MPKASFSRENPAFKNGVLGLMKKKNGSMNHECLCSAATVQSQQSNWGSACIALIPGFYQVVSPVCFSFSEWKSIVLSSRFVSS